MDDNVYNTPVSDVELDEPDSRELGRGLAVVGLVLFYAPFLAIASVIFMVVNSVKSLAETSTIVVRVEDSLWIVALGFFVGLVGLFLILVALLQKHNREPWFFWCTVSASLLWCVLLFPLGTLLGGLLLGIFLFRKNEFLDPQMQMQGGIEFIPQPELQE